MNLLESVKYKLSVWRENLGSRKSCIPQSIYEDLLECVFLFGIEEVKMECHLSGRTIGRLLKDLEEYKEKKKSSQNEDEKSEYSENKVSNNKVSNNKLGIEKLKGKFIPISKVTLNQNDNVDKEETNFIEVLYKNFRIRIDPFRIIEKTALFLSETRRLIEIKRILKE